MEIRLSHEDLRPVIQQIISEVIERFGDDDRLAYSEVEAAALLGVAKHVLRDDRLRGRVRASRVGNKVRYTRRQLLEYLEGRSDD